MGIEGLWGFWVLKGLRNINSLRGLKTSWRYEGPSGF